MLARPKIQRSGIDFIDHRRGEASASKINALNVILACVARFDANMIEFRRMKIPQLRGPFFAAIGAYYTAKLP